MRTGFMKHISDLIQQSDLIIELLDARHPEYTRNKTLENMVKAKRKKLLLVINKSDLVSKEELEKKKKEISRDSRIKTLFISASKKDGINLIRKEVSMESGNSTNFTVGIIGYPNVGKSTLINVLAGKGRGRVATSRKAGLTRGLSKVKVTDGMYLIDSPGIIPFHEDEYDLFLVESKNPNQLKDVDSAAIKLIAQLRKEICNYYGLTEEESEGKDEDDLLEIIALKKRFLQKGGKPDIMKISRDILERYQKHEFIERSNSDQELS